MASINVASISLLEELEASMAHFASEAREGIAAAERQIQIKKELLDQIVKERGRAVANWRSVCDDPHEEEDHGFNRRRLEEAEDELHEAQRWQRRVEEVCANHKRYMNQAYYLADKHTDKARLSLRTRIRDLHDYISLKPEVSHRDAGVGSVTSATETSASGITSLPLPRGFGWVSLSDLWPDDMQALPGDSDYRKDGLTEFDMQEGLRLLQTRILPEIQRDPSAATFEHFAELDAAEMRTGPHSLANIYAAYFSLSNCIWVSRFQGDRFFRIGNGRHRIKSAQDLGWGAVPGRIVEEPQKGED